jgi:hypothetical protein
VEEYQGFAIMYYALTLRPFQRLPGLRFPARIAYYYGCLAMMIYPGVAGKAALYFIERVNDHA